MQFPDYKRVIFQRNPLVEVVCQLKHPRVLAVDASLPVEMQLALQSEYPFLTQTRVDVVRARKSSSRNDESIESAPSASNIFDFLSKDKSWKVSLASTFIALTTSRYVRWEEFRDRLAMIVKIHRECYSLPFVDRIGLRYKDVIDRESLGLSDASWRELVRPELLGILGSPEFSESDIKNLQTTQQVAIPDGNLLMRSYFVQNAQSKHVGLMVDCDYWVEGQMESSNGDVFRTLESFHQSAGAVFSWAITERLRDALVPIDAG